MASHSRSASYSIQDAIARCIHQIDGLHYLNAPNHGSAYITVIHGAVKRLLELQQDDPLLYAYEVRDALDSIWPQLLSCYMWAREVIDSTPDQIQDTGAM